MERPLSTPGRRPYGDTAAERKILARMARLRDGKRMTWQAIADDLNARGLHKRNGKPWTAGTVQAIATGANRVLG